MTVTRVIAFGLLCVIAGQRYWTARRTPSLTAYHDRVRTSAEGAPHKVGPWIGKDVAVPAQALTVLRPNVMLSRRYLNVENGTTAGFMLVHCSDAHAMVGHFPLRCYPARGWKVKTVKSREWQVGDLHVNGMECEFAINETGVAGSAQSIVVANFLLRPGGKILRDMDELTASLLTAGGHAEGAGQVQVYFDAQVPQADRDAAILALVQAHRPVIDSILADVAH